MLAVIRFKVGGNVRYLSHAETMRVFQRACVRAGVRVAHSQGFNPHPRLSLVLPRSVGVESDDELLCLWLEESAAPDAELLKNGLAGELPEGFALVSVEISQSKSIPVPSSAKYLIRLHKGKTARQGIEELLGNEPILVERMTGENTKARTVDVRPYLKTIEAKATEITVECAVTPAGTIRVDEILNLLEVGTEDLDGPVRRTNVQWEGL